MKSKALSILLIIFLIIGIAPALLAADTTLYKHQTGTIYYDYNDSGVLIGQSAKPIVIKGTDREGNHYTTTITNTYKVINGQAYIAKSTSVTKSSKDDGSESTVTQTVTYSYDDKGHLVGPGATGKRITTGYKAAVDENGDGKISEEEMADRKYYEREETLTYKIINGEPKIVSSTTTKFNTYDKKGGSIISQLKPGKSYTTTYTYETVNGVTHMKDVTTDGYIEHLGEGDHNGTKPFDHINTVTHYAYDANGNLLPCSITVDDNGTPNDTSDDKFIDSNGNEITDTNGNGSITDEIKAKISGSYSITTTSGITKDAGNGWVTYTRVDITGFDIKNGVATPSWTTFNSNTSPLTGDADTAIDPQVTGKIIDIINVDGASHYNRANGKTYTDKITWIFVKDKDGNVWAVKYYTKRYNVTSDGQNYFTITEGKSLNKLGLKEGSTITLNGDLLSDAKGNSNNFMLQLTSITLEDGTVYKPVSKNASYSNIW